MLVFFSCFDYFFLPLLLAAFTPERRRRVLLSFPSDVASWLLTVHFLPPLCHRFSPPLTCYRFAGGGGADKNDSIVDDGDLKVIDYLIDEDLGDGTKRKRKKKKKKKRKRRESLLLKKSLNASLPGGYVSVYDPDGYIIETFKSSARAAEVLQIKKKVIEQVCEEESALSDGRFVRYGGRKRVVNARRSQSGDGHDGDYDDDNDEDDDDDGDDDDGDDDDNEDDDDDDENENDGNSDSELDDSLAHFHHDLFAFAPSDDKAVKNKRAKVTPSRGLKEQSDWRNEKSANSAIDVEQQARKASDAENRAPQKKGIAETSSSPMRPFEVPRYHPLVSLFYTVASNKSCVSCGSSRAVIRNNPCGHVTCCMACAEKPKRCLQCHLPIQKLSLMPPCP